MANLNPGYSTPVFQDKTALARVADTPDDPRSPSAHAARYAAGVQYWRRPKPGAETQTHHIVRALRQLDCHAGRAPSQKAWLDAIEAHPATAPLRADSLASLLKVARWVACRADHESMCTTTMTWDRLAELAGYSRRTIARKLAWLHAHGLLGRIAPGRSAEAAPQGEDQTALAPVYVLAIPHALSAVDEGGEEDGTPNQVPWVEEDPTHARPPKHPSGAAARPEIHRVAARGHLTPVQESPNPAIRSPRLKAIAKDKRVRIAADLRARIPALRAISDRHVASVIRLFVEAGWTADDLHHALDHRPDHRPHGREIDGAWVPFSGASGMREVGHWMNYRLRAWLNGQGEPMASKSQEAAERADRRRQEQLTWHTEREQARQRRAALQADPRVQLAKAQAGIDRRLRALDGGWARPGTLAELETMTVTVARLQEIIDEAEGS